MANASKQIKVYLEVGSKRTLAGALDWPGWCRGGRDAESALQALAEYGPRYERVLAAGLGFHAPSDATEFVVLERVTGNTTTDFGAPDVPPSSDADSVDATELRRLQGLLKACWSALDATIRAAEGKELRKGPRGGGRDLQGVVGHVVEAEASYLARLGGKRPDRPRGGNDEPGLMIERQRQAVLDTLAAAARGELPSQGPRGGARWSPRFFVRRAAWHVLDHVWEIEDRTL